LSGQAKNLTAYANAPRRLQRGKPPLLRAETRADATPITWQKRVLEPLAGSARLDGEDILRALAAAREIMDSSVMRE
jgi:hypothetical protein